jgi:hypothetical protein
MSDLRKAFEKAHYNLVCDPITCRFCRSDHIKRIHKYYEMAKGPLMGNGYNSVIVDSDTSSDQTDKSKDQLLCDKNLAPIE